MLDIRVQQICDDAACGNLPNRDDVMYLLRFDAYSPEAAYVCAKAREVGMRACGGQGRVYAQIGVDRTACPLNCLFCSFAAVNTDAAEYDPAHVELPIGRIVHYAKTFDAAGVDLISLMCTAALDFDRYLDMIRAVRASVSDDMTIMANAGDLTLERAQAVKDAGANAAYHAVRLGEGTLTSIKPLQRKRTMRYLRTVGLDLMTGIEPLWDAARPLEVSEHIMDLPDFHPFCIGACRLTEVRDGMVGKRKPALTGYVRYVAAIARLVCGEDVPIGGIGDVAWVDAGTDPRERGYVTDDDTLRGNVASAKRRLQLDGFAVKDID